MPTLLAYTLLFVIVGAGFIFIHLVAGKLIRPERPDPEKATVYECGEPTVGTAWIQFDLRFYVVALLFVIFDVELVFFFPWAVVFGKLNGLASPAVASAPVEQRAELARSLLTELPANITPDVSQAAANTMAWIAFADIVVFFAILMVGYAYLWKRGDLNWVRSTAAERMAEKEPVAVPVNAVTVREEPAEMATVGAGH